MKLPHFPPLIEDPPTEDSPDLTDDEIEQAVDTKGMEDLARLIAQEHRHDPDFIVAGHELRRRGEDLFWRVRYSGPDPEPDKVLVFKVNWIGHGTG